MPAGFDDRTLAIPTRSTYTEIAFWNTLIQQFNYVAFVIVILLIKLLIDSSRGLESTETYNRLVMLR